MKKILLTLLLSAVFGLFPVSASWYTDHIRPGANLYLFDISYPYWPESTYFACWNINFSPSGGYFYGGVSSPKAGETPGGVWSFWEHPAYEKRQVRNIYTAPYVYTKQYIGEGASGSAGSEALPFVRSGDWYTMALRIWTPDAEKNESYVGWWIKDKRANRWHLYGVFSVPYRADGFEKNSGFLEDFGHNGRNKRAIHRGAGYCMKSGIWYPADTISISIPEDTGHNSQRWLVEPLDAGRALSIQHSQNLAIERNLEPGTTHYFKIVQPHTPTLDKPRFSASAQRSGSDILVRWAPEEDSSPQLSYRIEVLEKGRIVYNTQEYLPFVRQKAVKLPKNAAGMSVRITLADIFDQQQTIVLDRIEAVKPAKPRHAAATALVAGVDYRLYKTDAPISSLAEVLRGRLVTKGRIDEIDLSIRGRYDSNFGAVYSGYIHAPSSGIYNFKLKSCDGSRLTIAGQTVIGNDSVHSSSEARGAMFLAEGYHAYRLEYFKNRQQNDYISLSLEWARGGEPFAQLSSDQLFVERDARIQAVDLSASQADSRLRLAVTGDPAKIDRVAYFCNGKELEEVRTAPFEYLTFPVEGVNTYKARIYDKDNISTDSRPLEYLGRSAKSDLWNYATIGEEHLAHKFGYDNGVFTVSGEGEYFVYRTVRGDFDISGYVEEFKQLDHIVERENWIGLMVKRKLTMDNDNDIAVFHTSASGLRSSADFSDYATTRMSSFRMNPGHRWLKVSRRGNVFTTYSSADGKTWTAGLERALPMPEELYVGITYLSTPGNTNSLFYGVMSRINIETSCRADAEPSADFELPADCNVLGFSLLDSITTAVRCRDGLKLIGADNRLKAVGLPARYEKVRSIVAANGGLMAVVTDPKGKNALICTRDAGRSWQVLFEGFRTTYPSGVYGEIVAVDPTDGNHILLGSSGEGVLESCDGGTSWKMIYPIDQVILEIGWDPVLTSRCALLTLSDQNEGRIYLSLDRGANWQMQIAVKGAEFRHLLFDRRVDNLFYINSTRGIYTSFTNCRTLNRIRVHLPGDKAYFASDGVVINLMRHFAIPVDGSAVYRSDIDQLFWQTLDFTPDWGVVFALDLDKTNKRTLRAFTQRGVYRSDDYGASWVCTTPLP